jgi:hypothetical protein
MVSWAFQGSLPVGSILHPRNKSVQDIRVNQIVPTTLPNTVCLTKQQHFWALTEELTEAVGDANATLAGKRLMKELQRKIEQALNPNIVQDEQRVRVNEQRVARENQQRVLDNTPILTIPRITDAQAIMQSRNPTAKRRLNDNPRIHWRVTRNNTPGGLPLIKDEPLTQPTKHRDFAGQNESTRQSLRRLIQ